MESGFIQRRPRKLTASLFLQAAVLLVSQRTVSLSRWAALVGLLGGLRLSRQSLWERMDAGAVAFLKQSLALVLGQKVVQSREWCPEGLRTFTRVLLQDSTTLALAPGLAKAFPGSKNQRGSRHGHLKIQTIYDLITRRFRHFSLSGFDRNDQAAAPEVLEVLQPGDLVVRDLGYFVFGSLERIAQAGAFFLSRLRAHTLLCESPGVRPMDLGARLRHDRRLDIPLFLGGRQMPVRLVALPLHPAVAAERRRRARNNRDRRCRPSRHRLFLLGWAIFVTNVPAQQLSASQVAGIYGLRWRIETIFKAWKSHFAMTHLPGGSHHQLLAVVYARLIFISALVVVLGPGWNRATGDPARAHSLLRLAGLLADSLLLLMAEAWGLRITNAWFQQYDYHGRYERRRRLNFVQKLMSLP